MKAILVSVPERMLDMLKEISACKLAKRVREVRAKSLQPTPAYNTAEGKVTGAAEGYELKRSYHLWKVSVMGMVSLLPFAIIPRHPTGKH